METIYLVPNYDAARELMYAARDHYYAVRNTPERARAIKAMTLAMRLCSSLIGL